MREKQPKHWVPRWLGLDPVLFKKCSGHLRARGKVTLYAMVVLHGFTAFTISLGVYMIYPAALLFLATFLVLITILYTADRLLITSARHWWSSWIRLPLALVLPVFNVAFFDLAFFGPDIRLLHQEKQETEEARQKEEFEEEAAPYRQRIAGLNLRKEALSDSIRLWDGLNIGELNGTRGTGVPGKGPVFEAQQEYIQRLIEGAEEEMAAAERKIEKQEAAIARLESQRKAKTAALPSFEDTGLAYRLALLYEKLMNEGSLGLSIFSACYFLFFLFFDSLLLLPVVSLPFEEYHDRVQEKRRQDKLLFEFRQSQLYQLQAAEIQMDIERRLLGLQYQSEREAAMEALQDIDNRLKEELKLIEELQAEEASLSGRFDKEFEKMAQVAVVRSMDLLEMELRKK